MRSWRDARLAKCLPYKHYHERLNPEPRLPFLSWVWWQAGEDNAMASEQKVEGTGMLFHQVTPELLASLVCFLPSHVSLCCDRSNLKEQGSWFKRKRIHYGAKAWQSLKVVGVRPGPGNRTANFPSHFLLFQPMGNCGPHLEWVFPLCKTFTDTPRGVSPDQVKMKINHHTSKIIQFILVAVQLPWEH